MQQAVPRSVVYTRISPQVLEKIPPQHLRAPFLVVCWYDNARVSLVVGSSVFFE
ncbi:MAG: hypothetical protein ACE5I5_16420 [Candidatus Heimdallarchaeota archaeon]